MISAHRRRTADNGQRQKEQAGDFQPQHVQDASNCAGGNFACAVEGADPPVLAATAPRDPEKSPAMSTKIAGWHD
jgi:hypothetical protein